MTDKHPRSDVSLPAPWNMLGAWAGTTEPVLNSAARAGLELSSLAGQRASAYMEIPRTLAACRSPFDLLQAQAAFWQMAGRQYAEAGQRVMAAWQLSMPAAMAFGLGGRVDARDFITFPEVHGDEAGEARRHPGGTRRAA
jgi:hypothetical protein